MEGLGLVAREQGQQSARSAKCTRGARGCRAVLGARWSINCQAALLLPDGLPWSQGWALLCTEAPGPGPRPALGGQPRLPPPCWPGEGAACEGSRGQTHSSS